MDTSPDFVSRAVERLVNGQPTRDGAGVRLTRLLTPDLQRRLDPFLMLDLFGTDRPGDYIGGFPDHPHRGFETVTLMLQGRMRHRDSAGNSGLLSPGSVQWMTAGRGVVHSEMPEQQEGAMEGFQLWLNLPAEAKMREPWYRDFAADAVPRWERPGVTVRVIAGRTRGVAGAVERERTEPLLLDVALEPGAALAQPLDPRANAFVAVARGAVSVAGTDVAARRLALLADAPAGAGGGVHLQAGNDGARLLLGAAVPLREPIAQLGPFVMNTRQQLQQAVEDFHAGRLGQRAAA